MATSGLYDFSKTPADNTDIGGVATTIGAMAPSAVGPAFRALAAILKKWQEDFGAGLTTTGSADAYLLDANSNPYAGAASYADGDTFAFIANFTNAGAATLNVESEGAKAIRKLNDQPLDPGDIVSGSAYTVHYDASANAAAGAFLIGTSISDFQPLDASLTAYAALVTAANKFLTFSGADTPVASDITADALLLLADADVPRLGTANTWAADQTVPDEAYNGTTWNGSNEVPTKNAIRDKIETIAPVGGTAPADAKYIVQTANSELSAEQALGALATGIVKNTTTTGELSIAAQGTDYYAPAGTDVAIADGGTGQSTANLGFNALAPTTTRGDLIRRGATVNERVAIGASGTVLKSDGTDAVWGYPLESFVIACSDETTAITAAVGKIEFRMPCAVTVTAVRASLTTAQTAGSIFTVDIHESGTTILSTKLTIDNTEKTSTTALAAAVISDTALADDAIITIDVDQIGNGTAKGLKVVIVGTRV